VNLWGYHIDTALEWIALVLLVVLAAVAYFYVIWFIQKYTTGMVGGFLLMLGGLGLVIYPAYYVLWSDPPKPEILVSSVAILVGCVSLLVGAFKLTNFRDF